MTTLPPPPVPADADHRHYDDMPLEVRRLRDSGIVGVADAEVFRCALLSWCVAWHQVPAGSLPMADANLCRLVGLGRDIKTWKNIKLGAMRGWRPFADGRLYHPVVSEKVIAAWNSSRLNRWAKECDRVRKENKDREKKVGLAPLAIPRRPDPIRLAWPKDFQWNSDGTSPPAPPASAGNPPENGLNGMEGKGMDVLERAPTGLSPKNDDQKSSPVAARATGLECPHTHDSTQIADVVAAITARLRVPS
jgi:hypothetical protein